MSAPVPKLSNLASLSVKAGGPQDDDAQATATAAVFALREELFEHGLLLPTPHSGPHPSIDSLLKVVPRICANKRLDLPSWRITAKEVLNWDVALANQCATLFRALVLTTSAGPAILADAGIDSATGASEEVLPSLPFALFLAVQGFQRPLRRSPSTDPDVLDMDWPSVEQLATATATSSPLGGAAGAAMRMPMSPAARGAQSPAARAVAAADASALGRSPGSSQGMGVRGPVGSSPDGRASGRAASAALRAAEVQARRQWARRCLAPMLDAVARAASSSSSSGSSSPGSPSSLAVALSAVALAGAGRGGAGAQGVSHGSAGGDSADVHRRSSPDSSPLPSPRSPDSAVRAGAGGASPDPRAGSKGGRHGRSHAASIQEALDSVGGTVGAGPSAAGGSPTSAVPSVVVPEDSMAARVVRRLTTLGEEASAPAAAIAVGAPPSPRHPAAALLSRALPHPTAERAVAQAIRGGGAGALKRRGSLGQLGSPMAGQPPRSPRRSSSTDGEEGSGEGQEAGASSSGSSGTGTGTGTVVGSSGAPSGPPPQSPSPRLKQRRLSGDGGSGGFRAMAGEDAVSVSVAPLLVVSGVLRNTVVHESAPPEWALAASKAGDGGTGGDGPHGPQGLSLPSVHVDGCQDAFVYILRPVRHVAFRACSRTHLVVAAAAGAVTVDLCEQCRVVTACQALRVTNCADLEAAVYVRSPPAVFGDCRAIRFAPHAAPFPLLAAHMRAAGLMPRTQASAPDAGCWDRAVDMSYRARASARASSSGGSGASSGSGADVAPSASVSQVPPAKFSFMVVPTASDYSSGGSQGGGFRLSGRGAGDRDGDGAGEGKEDGDSPSSKGKSRLSRKRSLLSGGFYEEGGAVPLPSDYRDAMKARLRQVREVRREIRDAGLDQDYQGTLQGAIQAHFREWLLSSGRLRQVSDLVRIFGGQDDGGVDGGEARQGAREAVQAAMEGAAAEGTELRVGSTTPLRLQAPPAGFGTSSSPPESTDADRADPGNKGTKAGGQLGARNAPGGK